MVNCLVDSLSAPSPDKKKRQHQNYHKSSKRLALSLSVLHKILEVGIGTFTGEMILGGLPWRRRAYPSAILDKKRSFERTNAKIWRIIYGCQPYCVIIFCMGLKLLNLNSYMFGVIRYYRNINQKFIQASVFNSLNS